MDTRDFDKWVGMWEKVMDTEDFKEPKPETPYSDDTPGKVDFFGQNRLAGDDKKEVSRPDVEYWNKVYRMMRKEDDALDPLTDETGVLTEENGGKLVDPVPKKPNMTNKEMGDASKGVANAANPIQPSSLGKDQDYKPSLVSVYQLEQIIDLKTNLQELECKLNSKSAFGQSKEGKKIQTQIDELKKKIDELSDSLTPDFLQSYLS